MKTPQQILAFLENATKYLEEQAEDDSRSEEELGMLRVTIYNLGRAIDSVSDLIVYRKEHENG